MSDNSTLDNLQEKLEDLKNLVKTTVDDIKAKYKEPKEPSNAMKALKAKIENRTPSEKPLASQVADLKAKYKSGEEEKQKTFQEKIDAIKEKYKEDK